MKRKDLLSKLPKSVADELQLPSISEDQEKDSDILKAEWNVYPDELMRIHPDTGKGLDRDVPLDIYRRPLAGNLAVRSIRKLNWRDG